MEPPCHQAQGQKPFIGIDAAIDLEYWTKNDDETVCHFCPNECKRTFIDAKRPDGSTSRYIAGFSCEKGTVESKEAMIALVAERKKIASQFPNIVDYESKQAFRHFYDPVPMPVAGSPIVDIEVRKGLFGIRRVEIKRPFVRSSEESWKKRKSVRIGIPRVLNIYMTAPWFRTYFESVGIQKQNVVFSDATTEEMWVEGGKYGSIDLLPRPRSPRRTSTTCLSSPRARGQEAAPLHLLPHPHPRELVRVGHDGQRQLPHRGRAPDVMKAAFTKEVDFFATRGIEYLDPAVSMMEPVLLARRMFEVFGPRLGITEDENDHACREAWKALTILENDVQEKGRAILDTVEDENRVAILVIGRPYHSDPGSTTASRKSSRCSAIPSSPFAPSPRRASTSTGTTKRSSTRGPSRARSTQPRVAGELLRPTARRRCGRRRPRGAPSRNVVVLDLSSSAWHDAPTTGSSTPSSTRRRLLRRPPRHRR
jgi:hypothetical protein